MSNMQWVFKQAKDVKNLLILATVLFILEAMASVSLTGIQKYIIDDVFMEKQFDLLIPLLLGLAVLALIYNLLHLYAARMRQKGEFTVRENLVDKVFRYLRVIPVDDFLKERTGKYVQNLTTDINRSSNVTAQTIPQGALQVTKTLLLCIIIGIASPVILISIMAISSAYIALGRYYSPRLRKAAREKTEKKTDLIVHMEEGISSTREVIAFYRQEWERSNFHKIFKRYFAKALYENRLKNQQILLSEPLRWIILLVVFAYGGNLVIQGDMSIGTFVIVYQFSSQLLGAFQQLFNFVMGTAGNMSAVERIREVLNGNKVKDGEKVVEGQVKEITFDDVSFQYEDSAITVLKHLNFSIPLGKKIAFVGTSGGGKSTVVQLLIRFYEPTIGRIRVNGTSLTQLNREKWLEKVAVVFQEPYLFPDTIRNNLLLGRDITDEFMEETCRRMDIHDLITSLPKGYETLVGERGIKLSGGQRQRLALVRALLEEPEILILDEATSALDLETERQVQGNLDEIRKGKTTLIIAHRLSTVIDADIIYVFDQGYMVEQGSHQELISQGGVYKRLVMFHEKADGKNVIREA